jgi:hypothetical protein
MIFEALVAVSGGLVTLAVGEVVDRVRAHRLQLTEAARVKQLSPGEKDLEEWKQIFRETVLATDGAISSTMEQFLSTDWVKYESNIKTRCLFEARAQAKRELDELLAKDEDAPKFIVGSARELFVADWNASKTGNEVVGVVERWHDKGYKFPLDLRAELLKSTASSGQAARDGMRDVFDEEDENG